MTNANATPKTRARKPKPSAKPTGPVLRPATALDRVKARKLAALATGEMEYQAIDGGSTIKDGKLVFRPMSERRALAWYEVAAGWVGYAAPRPSEIVWLAADHKGGYVRRVIDAEVKNG